MILTLNDLTKRQRDRCPVVLMDRMVACHGKNDLCTRDIGNFIIDYHNGRAIDGKRPIISKFLSDLYQQEIDRQLWALECSTQWDHPKAPHI